LQTEQRSGFASMRSPLNDILSTRVTRSETNPRCLTAGAGGGARNRSYTSCRLAIPCRPCAMCSKEEGDDPPPPPRTERISLAYATCT
jgi:hypothetical protein